MTNEQKPVLEITKVSKVFGKVTAVNEVSLTVLPGEIWALIGPNGAGKTTLIKTITGLYPPTSGLIEISGHDVWQEPVAAKKSMGYIPDEPWVYPYLTAREFLEFSLKLRGLNRAEGHKRIKILAQRYQIEELLDGVMADFSRGNKQKVIIIAALIHQPKLLVIDEPIVGLDTFSQQVTKKLFMGFAKEGGAILMCTHTLPIVQDIATKVGILNQGKLISQGTLTQLLAEHKKEGRSLEEIYLKLTEK